MAERKAVNKYYPPDFDPSKGSLNTQLNQHPLRKRAAKLDQGILIIRFELPFTCVCLKCQAYIGRGVRFNAQKQQVDKYFSTPIWQFTFKCPICSALLAVRTNPKQADFDLVSGLRKRVEHSTDDLSREIEVLSSEERQRLQNDPVLRQQRKTAQQQQAHIYKLQLAELISERNKLQDDFELNQLARRVMRREKQNVKRRREEGREKGVEMELADATVEDVQQSKRQHFNTKQRSLETQQRADQFESRNSSIFTVAPQTCSTRLISKALNRGIDVAALSNSKPNEPHLDTLSTIQSATHLKVAAKSIGNASSSAASVESNVNALTSLMQQYEDD